MTGAGTVKKPLLCRLGWHTQIYGDGAMFTSARRCNKCDEWVDKEGGAAVDAERRKWEDGSMDDLLKKLTKRSHLGPGHEAG